MVLAWPANWFQAGSCCCVMEQANVMMKLGWSWWWLSQGLRPHLFGWQAAGCVCMCFSIWHKGYGLSFRGDRRYVYRRMFAFCTIFNYRVCVCHCLCIYTCVWESVRVCRPSYLCVTGYVQKGYRTLSITQNSLTSFLAVCLSPLSPLLLLFSGKWSNPNLNWWSPLFTQVATQHK